MIPTLVPVKSSNLSAVGHAEDTLYVRFSGGEVFSYKGVTKEKHAALMRSPSKGEYFAKHIKGKYPTA